MKKLCAKNALLGLALFFLLCSLGSVGALETYDVVEHTWTWEYTPNESCACGNRSLFGTYIRNAFSGTCAYCYAGSPYPDGKGYAFLRFTDIMPGSSVVLSCPTVYADCTGPCSNSSNPLLFRTYGYDWTYGDLTWNNQPTWCNEAGECWNTYGGMRETEGFLPNASSDTIKWNLSSGGMYGGIVPDLDTIDLFLAETNSSVNTSYGLSYNCVLEVDGLYNFSQVNVNVFDNYAGISNSAVQVCTTDYENCITKFTDATGYVKFNVEFGTYIIDNEYASMNLSYSVMVTFTDEMEYVNIYYNTVGPGSIGGYVYWPNGTGAPLAIVNVSGTDNYVTVTEFDGQFFIGPIVKGNYTIQAFKAGLQSYEETFSCTGDDSINLDLQAGIIPPDGYAYTLVNISVFEGVTTPLPGATVQRWSYGPWCPESCFVDSTCRNTNCAGDRHIIDADDRITNVNGIAIMNHISNVSLPLPVQFYIYTFKSGFLDHYKLVTITGNYTPVYLYLSMPPNTTVNLHETQNLSGVSLRVIPNMGAAQTGVTNASGDAQFTFTSVISSLIVNATTINSYYMNKDFILTSLAGNPINKDFTLPYRNATSFNLYGFCIDNVGNLVDGVNIELSCASCAGQQGNPTYCDEYVTQGGGMYAFTNIPKPPTSNCFVHAIPPAGYALGDGHVRTFFPTPGDNYYNLTHCVRLIGQNITPGTIFLEGYVIEGTGRLQSGLSIQSGPFLYSINGSGYMDGTVSNGILYIDELGVFSNITIKFDIPNYEKRIFRIGLGNNPYTRTFTLDWIGIEETSTTEPTTTFPLITTTVVTTTLVDWNNYTIYTPSNETRSLFDNAFVIIISVATTICGFTTASLTFIILFVGLCVVLLANQVLKALGFKWSWFGF